MTQQIFSLVKEYNSDSLYSRSRFGTSSFHESVAIQPNTELQFLIYHSRFGMKLDFSVASLPAKKVGNSIGGGALSYRKINDPMPVNRRPNPQNTLFRTSVGAVISDNLSGPNDANNASARVISISNDDIWPGDDWGAGEFYDDGITDPDPGTDPNPGGGGGGGGVPQTAVEVRLYRPGENEPIHTWSLPAVEHSDLFRSLSFPIYEEDGVSILPDPELMKKYGWWKCVVVVRDVEPAFVQFTSMSVIKKVTQKEITLTKRWLNHAFWNVLNLITPQVSISGDTFGVQLAKELEHSTGMKPVNYTYRNSAITSHVQLTSIQIDAGRGKDVHVFLKNKRDLAYNEWQTAINTFENGESAQRRQARLSRLNSLYVKARARYESSLGDFEIDDAIIRFLPVFSNPSVSFSQYGIDGSIEFESMPNIFIGFGKNRFRDLIAYSEVEYSVKNYNLFEEILVDLHDFFTSGTNYNELMQNINTEIENVIESNSEMITKYLYMALGKSAGPLSVVEGIRGTTAGWEISFYDAVEHPDPSNPLFNHPDFDEEIEDISSLGSLRETEPGAVISGEASPAGSTGTTAAARYAEEDIPEKFKMGTARDRRMLDKVETIVVIMMENRSFDHFLGDLKRTYPSKDYHCFDPEFTNPPAGNFINPIPVCKASDAYFPDPNVTPISPEHAYGHVMRQISDGSYDITKPKSENDMTKVGLMQGFTKDIMYRFNEEGGNIKFPDEKPRFESPQTVMTYYTKEQLPTYYHLAENFKILDHWFAAHPGATWPNRIATHTGKLVSMHNFPLDDKRLGYLKERTIFDVLSTYGIDWKYMESNVSIMRLFDRFRTDDNNVIPLHKSQYVSSSKFNIDDDDLAELNDLLSKDELPRVLVIEPRFSDAPPLKKAYDDLAPADISSGQAFIQTVYEKLLNSAHWDKIALLITYDEHGGFFDHMPPPGTQYSEHPEPYPPIYVDPKDPENQDKWGPTHLGVRVPAILVSPFVDKHSVSHTIFDHTSILKTILVHNRTKIPPNTLASFGERVNQANHLGMALDETLPRMSDDLLTGLNTLKMSRRAPKKRPSVKNYYTQFDRIDPQDYHETLRKLYMPK